MNIQNTLLVRDRILTHPTEFTMEAFKEISVATDCGTVGCIAGFASDLLSAEDGVILDLRDPQTPSRVISRARRFMGLSEYEANLLFYPSSMWPDELRKGLAKLIPGTLEYAQYVATVIDTFIAYEGSFVEVRNA